MTVAPRVNIVYQHLPFYRAAVFRRLSDSPLIDARFYADVRALDKSIPVSEPPDPSRFTALSNLRVGRFLWQRGLLRAAWCDPVDTWVMLGDWSYLSTWVVALVARARGQRVLFWTHGWRRRESGWRLVVRRFFYRLANGLLLYSDRGEKLAIEAGLPPDRLTVVFNSLDIARQQEEWASVSDASAHALRTHLFPRPGGPVVICSARLRPGKSFEVLVRAAASLDRSAPISILFVGDGPERSRLEKLCADLGVSASFVGACYDEARLARYYAISTLSVCPAHAGLSVLQSIGYGVPVLLGDVADEHAPEYEAVVPGVSGAAFESGSVDSLAESIRTWISAPRPHPDVVRATLDGRWTPEAQEIRILGAVLDGRRR